MTTVARTREPTRRSSRSGLRSLVRRTRAALLPVDVMAGLHPRPTRTASVRRPGPEAHHILLVGGGVLAGVGIARHDLGLPGRLADRLVKRTQRGVQIQIMVEEDPTSEESIARLLSIRLQRFDTVLVFLGAGPAEHRVTGPSWRTSIERLARTLDTEAAATARLHVYDSSEVAALLPITSGGARTLARAAQLTEVNESVFEHTRRLRFQALCPPTPLHGPTGTFSDYAYDNWADVIAEQLQSNSWGFLDVHGLSTPGDYRDGPQSRQAQIDAGADLHTSASFVEAPFLRDVRTVQQVFGVEGAAIALLHKDRLHPIGATPLQPDIPDPAANMLCDLALRRDQLALINDASQDLMGDGGIVASAGLRFWASQPIHSWDGHRIGAFYLFDTRAHTFVPSQLHLLEDVVGRVEQYLWATEAHRPVHDIRVARSPQHAA